MRSLPFFFAALLAMPATAHAQDTDADAARLPVAGPERIVQVFVYGEDPCPKSEGDDILVCARLPDNDRNRIPKELRTDPNSPQVQSWANRAKSIEYVGRTGTDSCTPVGGGGFTGCFQQMAAKAREERKAMLGSESWADAVAREREKRLGNLDAESDAIEAEVKADEAAAAASKPR
jgi:hypothetical protein